MICATFKELAARCFAYPARNETPRHLLAGDPIRLEGDRPPRRKPGLGARAVPVTAGAAFVLQVRENPYMNRVHPMHKTLGVKFFVAGLATLLVLSPDKF
jgi:hypothetical protein